jgi:hypothetical protein
VTSNGRAQLLPWAALTVAFSPTLLELIDPIVLTSRQLEKQNGMVPLGVIPKIR